MKVKSKLAAATLLAAAAATFGACRADDGPGGSGASQAASKTTTTMAAKPSPPAAAAPAPAEEAKRVTVDELKKMLDSGKAVVYDTRAKAAYDAEHIKGSLSMPFNEVADRAGELPKDKMIVFYCT